MKTIRITMLLLLGTIFPLQASWAGPSNGSSIHKNEQSVPSSESSANSKSDSILSGLSKLFKNLAAGLFPVRSARYKGTPSASSGDTPENKGQTDCLRYHQNTLLIDNPSKGCFGSGGAARHNGKLGIVTAYHNLVCPPDDPAKKQEWFNGYSGESASRAEGTLLSINGSRLRVKDVTPLGGEMVFIPIGLLTSRSLRNKIKLNAIDVSTNAESALTNGSDLYSSGFPGENHKIERLQSMGGRTQSYLEARGKAPAGMSGGPVTDPECKSIVGVVSGRRTDVGDQALLSTVGPTEMLAFLIDVFKSFFSLA